MGVPTAIHGNADLGLDRPPGAYAAARAEARISSSFLMALGGRTHSRPNAHRESTASIRRKQSRLDLCLALCDSIGGAASWRANSGEQQRQLKFPRQ